MELNHVRYVLTAPADPAVFQRIEQAYADLDGFIARLAEKKIDVLHFVATRRELAGLKTTMEFAAENGVLDKFHVTHRALSIYFRAQLLALLDEEDAWVSAPKQKPR